MTQFDAAGSGTLPSADFVRCLSASDMKLTDRDVDTLIKEMEKSDASGEGKVNYKDFLKYSYLCLMYLNHFDLELQLKELDSEKIGLVKVAQLDEILQSKDCFGFPPSALDQVFTEMLG